MSGDVEWRKAGRAIQALLADPDDTQQVFVIIEALSGKSPERNIRRLRRHPIGKKLLADKPDILRHLRDRRSLEALPAGSVGRGYLDFVDSEGISADGLVQASEVEHGAAWQADGDMLFLRDRMRDTHDLWHTVTGYKGDLVGEGALLAFSFAQTWNPGVGFIITAGFLKGREIGVRRQILRGLSRGLRAEWLPAVEWEKQLARPLAEVRRELRLGEPPEYVPVRTSELAAAGLL
jgi:ubiquinone biosynthesis protein COQ4